MSKNRASKGLLITPRTLPAESAERRREWLANAKAGFVSPSRANKAYYSVLLDALWPEGHGIPGPHLTQDDLRASIDQSRATRGEPAYKDVFRRVRELQGEEGFTCIIKEGTKYQLVNLDIAAKKEPRGTLSKSDWKLLREKYGYKCAHCGKQEPEVKLSPDHRRPRSRGGSNDVENWQPLCEQCNNLKSSSCRGCELNCSVCSWAFPEDYKPIAISDDNKELIRRGSEKRKLSQSELVNLILRNHFNNS